MKFDQICRYIITESFKDKFIAITDIAEEVEINDEEALKIAKKPQVNLPEINKNFIKKIIYELKYQLPSPEEVDRQNSETQFSKQDVIDIIARKIYITLEPSSKNKAANAGLLIFRLLGKKGILTAIPWAKAKKQDEDEQIARALDDPESEWLGSADNDLSHGSIEGLTGGYGPTADEW